ncbi:MAG: hypothetical protein ABJC36_00580 [Gemmatimonadales bacterium]
MRPILLTFPLLLATLACRPETADRAGAADSTPAPPAPADTEPWTIRLDGVGPISFGMSLVEARAALADSLPVAPPDASCGFTVPRGAPAGLRLMVEGGKVVRADVDSSDVRTAAGAEVGMSEADVRGLYPDGLRVQPHKYDPKGRYLVVQESTPANSARRLIFETDGQRVVRYRAGITPAVEYVEGCA